MKAIHRVKVITFLSFICLINACATLSPEEQYANSTAKNISIISSRLHVFSEAGLKLSQQRISALNSLDKTIRDVENDIELDYQAMKMVMSGCKPGKCTENDKLQVYENILKLSMDIKEIDQEANKNNRKLIDEINSLQTKRTVPSKDLKDVQGKLVSLGKTRDFEKEVKFLYKFGAQVKNDVDSANKKAEEAQKEGKKKIEDVTKVSNELINGANK